MKINDFSAGSWTLYFFDISEFDSFVHFQVEPSTKLYPAVFVEPTVKEVLQFELGRIKVKSIEKKTD